MQSYCFKCGKWRWLVNAICSDCRRAWHTSDKHDRLERRLPPI